MSLDVMKQALEALEEIADEVFSPYDNKLGDAILALRAAIEQAQRNEFNPDWDQVEALRESLREHMAEIQRLRAAIEQAQEPFCYHDGRNIVGKEFADHSDVFPLYTSPNQEQQKPVRFNCTVIDDAHLNGVPLSQWGKQPEMQPCAGRNCGSTNPNLHSAECFEDYEKATGMNQRKTLMDDFWDWLPKAYGDVGDEPAFTKYNMEVAYAAGAEAEAKRMWQGLTDEEIAEIAATPAAIPGSYVHSFARAIEAKLREKNS